MRSAAVGLLIAAVAACEHTSPFTPGPYAPTGPRGSGSPLRLTYSAGQDRDPIWLPDGSAFLYSREHVDRFDRDYCVARFPAGGGSITTELCDRWPAAVDSTDAYTWPASAADGRLAYVRASSSASLRSLAPHDQQLVLGGLDQVAPVRVLQSIPYQGPSGRGHEGIAQIRWLTSTTLVYVGQSVRYVGACGSCSVDTIATGLELVRMNVAPSTPVLEMLPGTDQASSVAVAGDDTIYFTVNGDSRVQRLILSTGTVSVVHDFGEITRDVQVAGNRLVAVVGGDVSFSTDSMLGPLQRDGGGNLVVLNLATGTVERTDSGFYRHPALAPSGTTVIVEMVAGGTTDLWEVTLP